MDKLGERIERVEQGRGADWVLDGAIAEILNPDRFVLDLIRGHALLHHLPRRRDVKEAAGHAMVDACRRQGVVG
jgi:hypothetical protein